MGEFIVVLLCLSNRCMLGVFTCLQVKRNYTWGAVLDELYLKSLIWTWIWFIRQDLRLCKDVMRWVLRGPLEEVNVFACGRDMTNCGTQFSKCPSIIFTFVNMHLFSPFSQWTRAGLCDQQNMASMPVWLPWFLLLTLGEARCHVMRTLK